jgi:hypothetical protein
MRRQPKILAMILKLGGLKPTLMAPDCGDFWLKI